MANGQTNISGGKTLIGTAQPSDVRMGMTYADGKELRDGTLNLTNLLPENIREGVNIGGVVGECEPLRGGLILSELLLPLANMKNIIRMNEIDSNYLSTGVSYDDFHTHGNAKYFPGVNKVRVIGRKKLKPSTSEYEIFCLEADLDKLEAKILQITKIPLIEYSRILPSSVTGKAKIIQTKVVQGSKFIVNLKILDDDLIINDSIDLEFDFSQLNTPQAIQMYITCIFPQVFVYEIYDSYISTKRIVGAYDYVNKVKLWEKTVVIKSGTANRHYFFVDKFVNKNDQIYHILGDDLVFYDYRTGNEIRRLTFTDPSAKAHLRLAEGDINSIMIQDNLLIEGIYKSANDNYNIVGAFKINAENNQISTKKFEYSSYRSWYSGTDWVYDGTSIGLEIPKYKSAIHQEYATNTRSFHFGYKTRTYNNSNIGTGVRYFDLSGETYATNTTPKLFTEIFDGVYITYIDGNRAYLILKDGEEPFTKRMGNIEPIYSNELLLPNNRKFEISSNTFYVGNYLPHSKIPY